MKDDGIACSVSKKYDVGFDNLDETRESIVVPLSDGTLMIIALWGDRIGIGKVVVSDGVIGDFYWSRLYDLADPKAFEHVMHLIVTNVKEK